MKLSAFSLVIVSAVVTGTLSQAGDTPQNTFFHPPFRVEAQGNPIDVEVGHAAPLVVDFDGDQKNDLLVGQFGGGKLRIYRNTGSPEAPQFEAFAWFKASRKAGTVPAG